MPTWLPSSPMRRTCGTRIRSLMRVSSRSGRRRSNLRGIGTSGGGGRTSKGEQTRVRDGARARQRGSVRVRSVPFIRWRVYRRFSNPPIDFVARPLDELLERGSPPIAFAVTPDGHGALLLLLVADDQHVRHLPDLRLADLLPDRLRALVQLRAQSGPA